MRRLYAMTIRRRKLLALLLAPGLLGLGVNAYGRDGVRDDGRGSNRGSDRVERAQDKADRDTVRNADRASENAAKDDARYQEEHAKIAADAEKDPFKAQEELAKLNADYAEEQAQDAADAAEDAAKLAEDIADAEADEAEDAAKDAAEDTEFGDSQSMRDLAKSERPEFDRRGFPVRRGEISALDIAAEEVAAAQANGFVILSRQPLPALNSELIRFQTPDGLTAEQALAAMRHIAPNGEFDYTHYYGMQVMPAGKASGKAKSASPSRGGAYTIGMIDTGVARHDGLAGHTLSIADFGQGKGAIPTDHGTAIASILVNEGVTNLFVANIFRGGTDAPFTSAEAIASALDWMMGRGVRVVNMSLSGPRNAVLDTLIKRGGAKGMLIVAAAGNGGPGAPPSYPAALSSVVAVTAVDGQSRVYRYANQGDYISIAARGVDVPAANAKGGWSLFSGTSFATPHVAAWFAGCMTKATAATCKTVMQNRAIDLGKPGRDPVYGHGLLR